jgi:Fe-Mn family superoxide dismutase
MTPMSRRDLLRTAGAGAALLTLPTATPADEPAGKGGGFHLPLLPYAVDALEPHIDAKTMEIHYGRHHKAYVDNLNKALTGTEWAARPVEQILVGLDKVPENLRTAVRNNAGGHYNHTLFWQMMSPKGGKPAGELNTGITNAFKDLDGMFKQLKDAALGRFGSGWAWVVVQAGGKLAILSTPNQDSPLMTGPGAPGSGAPILGIDVWEHAYYLKYQNKRAEYVDAFFKVINWEFVSERYADLAKG